MENYNKEKEEFKLITKTNEDVEIEVMVAKEIPNLIRKKLIEKHIDSYIYNPHPLLNGIRLHICSQNPVEDLIEASNDVEKELKEFKELINKEFMKVKDEENKEEKIEGVREEKSKEKETEKEDLHIQEQNITHQSENHQTKRKRGRPQKKI